LTVALAGCGGGDGLQREAVSGTVKFKGEPFKEGLIEFQPATPTLSTTGAAPIKDGSYSISSSEGLQPGKYEVRITGAAPLVQRKPGEMPGDNPAPATKEIIPPKYNSKTTLSAEVKSGEPNKFDFDLQEK
jgi:hypothetical protein